MKIIGLDGKEYDWKPVGSSALENQSKLHCAVREILKEIFPFNEILEEVELVGTKRRSTKNLTADFFIPIRNLIVEAHGEQHYEYSNFFYGKRFNFHKAQTRDQLKKQWCEQNNITIVELSYKDKPDTWRQTIANRR